MSSVAKQYRVIVVGESGVGKTCLIERMKHDEFDPDKSSTVGVSSFQVNLKYNDKEFDVSLFDTAGQERYRSITRSFYRGSHVVLVVFDMTDRTTMDALRQWFEELEDYIPDSRKIIVGTKCDLELKVDLAEASKFAECMGAEFVETSAKNGYGIEDLLTLIGKSIFEISEEDKRGP